MKRNVIIWESALCFALPAYHLLWGVLMLPLMLIGAARGETYALIHALCAIGGCLGLIALRLTLRYLFRPEVASLQWSIVLPFMAAGLLSIWTAMTGQFAGFDFNWFLVVSAIAPSICAAHLVWLAVRKSLGESPVESPAASEGS